MGDKDVNTLPDHLIGKLFGAIASPVGTAELDVNVLAFRIAEGVQTPPESPARRRGRLVNLRADATPWANTQLRKLPRARKACQRCLAASFRLTS